MNSRLTVSTSRRLAFAYAILVIAVSSLPGVKMPNLGEGNLDVALHFAQYSVLGFLVSLGWGPGRQTAKLTTLFSAFVLVFFSAADEIHQLWIPGRFAEWGDWLADIVGLTLGFFAGYSVNRVWARPVDARQEHKT